MRRVRHESLVGGLGLLLALVTLAACRDERTAKAPSAPTAGPHFLDVSQSSGLDFRHRNGALGGLSMVELLSGATALVDYDRDGDLDVFAVQGIPLDSERLDVSANDRLFRNEGISPVTGELFFVDATAGSGIAPRGYGMAVAVGDLDADGWPDLYRTAFGNNQLWVNRRDGSFVERTGSAETADRHWSTAATFADVDGDGDEDLWVVNYVRYDLGAPICSQPDGQPDYCGPDAFEPAPDQLFLNDGTGRLEVAGVAAGIAALPGPGLGILTGNWRGDERPEILVANDHFANRFWTPKAGGQWTDEAPFRGVALNAVGAREASMGITANDFDSDGDEDLFITHLRTETNTLYVDQGSGVFLDETERRGLGRPSWPATAFGAEWLDVDGDGRDDLLTLNGHIRLGNAEPGDGSAAGAEPARRLAQAPQFFRAAGDGTFAVAEGLPDSLVHRLVGRGLTAGDLDNDGYTDLLASLNDGPLLTLEGTPNARPSWWAVHFRDERGATVSGCAVHRETPDGTRLHRARRTSSYLSSRDPRILGTLRPNEAALAFAIDCGGRRARFLDLPADRYLVLAGR